MCCLIILFVAIAFCFRWHTLAYIESTGQLYSFGRNNYGQLGVGTTEAREAPCTVKAQWTKYQGCSEAASCFPLGINGSYSNTIEYMDVQHGSYVFKIFSGGSQNFAILYGLQVRKFDD